MAMEGSFEKKRMKMNGKFLHRQFDLNFVGQLQTPPSLTIVSRLLGVISDNSVGELPTTNSGNHYKP
uniref:Uncharacterized protein n=1 Tax=Cucumis melo TaxID=3656 RepID=A0A9I9EM17_CUCME